MKLITLICENGGEMTFVVDHIVAVYPLPDESAMILTSTMTHYHPTHRVHQFGGGRDRIGYKKLCEILEKL